MHPGNVLLIGITRSEKRSQKTVCYVKKSVKMSHVSFLCKLVPPLLKNLCFTISQPLCAGAGRGRSHDKRPTDYLQQDLADRGVAHAVDPISHHRPPQERQPIAMPELSYHQPHQPPEQSYAEKILLNRLKPQAEKIIAEEQPGFRPEQIFNIRVLCEKYLQHQQDLYHVFIDFEKAFDRVWHAALWATMKHFNTNANLIRMIQNLYDKATSAVYLNNSIGGLVQNHRRSKTRLCALPTLFNNFLERIMTDALNDREGTVSIGGRNITNLRFADDIDGLAGREEELADLVERLDKTSTTFGMQINAEKTTLMTNNTNGFSTDIRVNGEKLVCVNRFKYLGAIITDEGSKHEILVRIAQATAALAKLKTICNDRNIALSSKIRLVRSLGMSIFLYACESWTLTVETEKRIQEMRCLRKLLGITYRDHITNEEVQNRTRQTIGPHEDLLTTVKQRKLRWYGHITRSSGLAKTIMQGTVQ